MLNHVYLLDLKHQFAKINKKIKNHLKYAFNLIWKFKINDCLF